MLSMSFTDRDRKDTTAGLWTRGQWNILINNPALGVVRTGDCDGALPCSLKPDAIAKSGQRGILHAGRTDVMMPSSAE